MWKDVVLLCPSCISGAQPLVMLAAPFLVPPRLDGAWSSVTLVAPNEECLLMFRPLCYLSPLESGVDL